MLDTIVVRFRDNLARVENLLRLYEDAHGQGRGRRSVQANDLLRATTVFLHATLEDFLRSVARWRLPLAGPEVLDDIPLVGGNRGDRFKLGAVSRFRGKSVDEVINDSVAAYLDRSNYNNTREIAAFLQNIGLTVENVNGRFHDLDALMQRRHLIVHQADRNPQLGRGTHRARHITVHQVRTWITAVRDFVGALESELRVMT